MSVEQTRRALDAMQAKRRGSKWRNALVCTGVVFGACAELLLWATIPVAALLLIVFLIGELT